MAQFCSMCTIWERILHQSMQNMQGYALRCQMCLYVKFKASCPVGGFRSAGCKIRKKSQWKFAFFHQVKGSIHLRTCYLFSLPRKRAACKSVNGSHKYKGNSKDVKPPDLWIHHERLELKPIDKSPDPNPIMTDTPIPRNSQDITPVDNSMDSNIHQRRNSYRGEPSASTLILSVKIYFTISGKISLFKFSRPSYFFVLNFQVVNLPHAQFIRLCAKEESCVLVRKRKHECWMIFPSVKTDQFSVVCVTSACSQACSLSVLAWWPWEPFQCPVGFTLTVLLLVKDRKAGFVHCESQKCFPTGEPSYTPSNNERRIEIILVWYHRSLAAMQNNLHYSSSRAWVGGQHVHAGRKKRDEAQDDDAFWFSATSA